VRYSNILAEGDLHSIRSQPPLHRAIRTGAVLQADQSAAIPVQPVDSRERKMTCNAHFLRHVAVQVHAQHPEHVGDIEKVPVIRERDAIRI